MEKRNIVFLMTDQQRFDALGIVNPHVKTPNLDALAKDGVLYAQAVCNCPMCVPSRYSMMLGLYPSQIGVRHNMQMIERDEKLPAKPFAQRLSEAGYQTACFGKTHWFIGEYDIAPAVSGVVPSKRGFDVRYETGKRPSADRTDTVYLSELDQNVQSSWADVDKIVTQRGGEDVAGYIGKTCEAPTETMDDYQKASLAVDWVVNRRKPDQPFFLYLSLNKPHAPLTAPAEFEALYDIDQIPDTPLPPPDWTLYEHTTPWRHREAWAKLDAQTKRRTTLRYWALCSYSDAQFGRLLGALRAQGLYENTDFIFCSDHGDSLGERYRFSKYSLYEPSVRVPLIVRSVRIAPAQRGSVDARPAELVDVLPTLLDFAGLDCPEEFPGRSLLAPPCREGQFAEFSGSGYHEVQYGPKYMWRRDGYKLVLHVPGKVPDALTRLDSVIGELYNLKEDPLEIDNLYEDPAHFALRERMTRQLLTHLMICWAKFPRGMSTTRV